MSVDPIGQVVSQLFHALLITVAENAILRQKIHLFVNLLSIEVFKSRVFFFKDLLSFVDLRNFFLVIFLLIRMHFVINLFSNFLNQFL